MRKVLLSWWTIVFTVIAAIAAVIGNIEKIAGTADHWLGDYLRPQGIVEIAMMSSLQRELTVALTAGAEVTKMGELTAEKPAVFAVRANAGYKLIWMGPGYKAGSYDILVPPRRMRWVFRSSGQKEEDLDVLELRLEGGRQAAATAPAPAGLLIAASAAQIAQNPAIRPARVNLIPELDRALTIEALFEVGTTDCGSHISIVSNSISGSTQIIVGCLGFGIPGQFADILRNLDQEEPKVLDTALADFAPALRQAMSASSTEETSAALSSASADEVGNARLTAALRRLVQTPQVRAAQSEQNLRLYRQALRGADELGLVSERGVLFVFDRLVNQGPSVIKRLQAGISAKLEQRPQGGGTLSEGERLVLLGDLVKGELHGRYPFLLRRIDAIVSGRGTFNGIDYDFTALGIRDDVPMAGHIVLQ